MTNFLTEIQLAVTLNTSTQIQGPLLKSTGITPDFVSHHSPVSTFQRATAERQDTGLWSQTEGSFPTDEVTEMPSLGVGDKPILFCLLWNPQRKLCYTQPGLRRSL